MNSIDIIDVSFQHKGYLVREPLRTGNFEHAIC